MPFLDDIGVKGPYIDYRGEEILLGICRFIFEYILNVDRALERLERAGACIGPKSQFLKNGLNVVGFVSSAEGRHSTSSKIIKILE